MKMVNGVRKYLKLDKPIPKELTKTPYRKCISGKDSTINVYLYNPKKRRFELEKIVKREFGKGLFGGFHKKRKK